MLKSTLFPGLLACVVAFVLVSPAQAQTTIMTEDFNGTWSTTSPPPGWRIVFTGDTSENDWHRRDASSEPWTDNATPYAGLLNEPGENGYDSLITPSVNCEDYNVVVLRCSTKINTRIGPYSAELRGSVDGGPFDHFIADYTGQNMTRLQTFDVSSWAGNQANVRFVWLFDGDVGLITYWCVDNISVTGDNSTSDVGVDSIIAPSGTVDSGSVVTPQVFVKNFGNTTVTDPFKVEMRIGLGYRDSTMVTDTIEPDESIRVSFPDWRARETGQLPMSSETFLLGDVDPENNSKIGNVQVESRDVGPLIIIAPPDTVDSASVVQPQAQVKNFGNVPVDSFRCYFRIGSWRDSRLVLDLDPGGIQDLSFDDWFADTVGNVVALCSTYWADDLNEYSDTMAKRFFVLGSAFKDVAAVSILDPRGAVRESTIVFPKGQVLNLGPEPASFNAYFKIDSDLTTLFHDTVFVSLAGGQADTVSFDSWVATPEGNYTTTLYVHYDGDMGPDNDTVEGSFDVQGQIHDVACDAILSPVGQVQVGQTIMPSARVNNPGDFTEGFWTLFSIFRGASLRYKDSVRVDALEAGASQVLDFSAWTAAVAGEYNARCSTKLDGDANPVNNLKVQPFTVESIPFVRGWEELTPFPAGQKGIGKGAGLAYMAGLDGNYVYGTRGYKFTDFYRYNIAGQEWEQLTPVPMGARELYTGGCLDGDREEYIYCVNGNKTVDFFRYACSGDSWSRLADIPLGPDDREVKKGSDLEPVHIGDTLYMYLLKGDRLEFYRYNTVSGIWEARASVPEGTKAKVDKGSFIAYDGQNTIYFFKAKYNETWAYDIMADEWLTPQLTGMPFVGMMGRKKKMKDGAAGCWFRDKVICMKGGNTQECWEFDPAANAWTELETIPAYGSTQRKKKVKYGGDMQSDGNGRFYVTKGKKTLEFWRYSYSQGGSGIRSKTLPDPEPVNPSRMTLVPNPARGRVNLALPGIGTAVINVYDAHGALLGTTSTATGRASLDLHGMSPGVYFIQADYGLGTETSKLIIE